MLIAVNKAHFPVTVLGPGRRIGIWLQGCSIRCPGCVSRDTWEPDRQRMLPVETLLGWCREVAAAGLDGITISGGEPFDQAEALECLLRGLIAWREQDGLAFDVLCYSGWPLRELDRRHAQTLALLDALIPEPYIDAQATDLPWRGSENQPLVALSPLGAARYGATGAHAQQRARHLQVRVDGKRIWYIGIPRRGDMDRLAAGCRERGLEFTSMSWRA